MICPTGAVSQAVKPVLVVVKSVFGLKGQKEDDGRDVGVAHTCCTHL